MSNLFTALAVLIGALWIGIGMKIGETIYNELLETKTKSLLKRLKREKPILQTTKQTNNETPDK